MQYAIARKRYGWVGVLAIGIFTACSGNPRPNTSPEGTIADYGRRVINVADSIVTTIDKGMTAGQIPQSVGLPVLQTLKRVGQEGVRLADALAVVDKATDESSKAKGLEAAQAVLRTLQRLVAEAVIPINDANGRKQAVDLLASLSDVLLLVAQVLPPPPGSDPEPLILLAEPGAQLAAPIG